MVEEDEDEEGVVEEKAKKDKLTVILAAEHTCEIKDHGMGWCWVQNDGEHIPLERKDLSSWALWIVSHGCLSIAPLLI